MKKEICAGGVVFTRKDGEPHFLLLCGRTTGWWVFPKGHVKKGETLLETAKREVAEETGFSDFIHHEEFLEVISFINEKGNKKNVYHYLFEADSFDSKISEEHVESVWLKFDEAYKRIDHENQKNILKKAYEKIKNG